MRAQEFITEATQQDFLWHGSREPIEVLEPRQAVDTGGAAGSNQNAIYATRDKDFAIKMGLTTPGSDTAAFKAGDQIVLFKGNVRHGQNVYLHRLPRYDANSRDMWIPGGNANEFYSRPDITEIQPIEIIPVPVDQHLDMIRRPTAQDWKLRRKYLKRAKQDVAEGLDEMDKSAPQPGRDGRVSHSTYGSRDKKGSDYFKGKEAPGKPVTKKKMAKDALDILKKSGVAEGQKR